MRDSKTARVSIGIGESGLTEVELAVDLLTVDDVELVRHASVHVAELKVEPLVVVVRVHIAVYYQVILVLTHLDRFSTLTLLLLVLLLMLLLLLLLPVGVDVALCYQVILILTHLHKCHC